ncbi:MAG TPA: propionyl-CoA synthetase [Spirochaetota bacterium]|nr:propionyl-CoA synthetase [Spirochaetota bacterium]HOR93801.1 propionyl-CoA synthetase [Spirochaetota bacterium]HOT18960.1 propionyl-CoA synthetase [Spirochaetota bacterium]HPK44262.1 propionyl-CoA synthetase [Spirochaetota bacterium]HQG43722.1 propionyl-CoA synthetase [Spirochaetota bacterium]
MEKGDQQNMSKYQEAYDESINNPEKFWGEAAKGIHWYKPYTRVLDDSKKPFYRWFVGGELNTCYNAIDRHVDSGNGSRIALIYDSPVTGTIAHYSYKELLDKVSLFAGALQKYGIKKGDRVIIYMPMIPEALYAMLACARIGAIHSVVFGGFAPNELAIRIDDAKPKLIVSASCGVEGKKVIEYKPLLDKAIEIANHKPDHCIIFQRPQVKAPLEHGGRDIDYNDALSDAKPADCVPVASTDPLYILYTSGTTGIPKGVVRDNGGHAVVLNWSMKNIYNIQPGDVWWAASDVGWVVGHSYIVYAPLLYGATTILYEGKPVGTPDPGAFWRVISQHKVKALFTAPTAFRAIKKEDPNGEYFKKYDLSQFNYLFLAGERLDPDTYYWATDLLKKPVIDHWWQTETGWPIAANCVGIELLPIKAGSPTKPVPGYQVQIINEEATVLPNGTEGIVVIKLPLPPGTLLTLWQNDEKFKESYLDIFDGYYFTGDGGYFDEDGYLYIMGRIDDVINVAGHRLSTGAMEEVISKHPDVAECAVIGAEDSFKGQLPVGFVVLKEGVKKSKEQITSELAQMVRDQIGAVACYKTTLVVQRLPKTRSGKILRGTMRKIADNKPFAIPSTIDDPSILDEIKDALSTISIS